MGYNISSTNILGGSISIAARDVMRLARELEAADELPESDFLRAIRSTAEGLVLDGKGETLMSTMSDQRVEKAVADVLKAAIAWRTCPRFSTTMSAESLQRINETNRALVASVDDLLEARCAARKRGGRRG